MSSTKDYWHDEIVKGDDSWLAERLGISEDELDHLTYAIEEDRSGSGDLYGYNVVFYGENDPEIMGRIVDLEDGDYVSLQPWELSPEETIETWDDEVELTWQVNHSDQLETFEKQMASVSELLDSSIDEKVQFSFLVMLHAHIISSFEYFLASTYIYSVTNSDTLTRRLIKSNPEFKKQSFKFNEIYEHYDNIKTIVAKYLNDIIFHNIKTIKPMFSDVLLYEFEKSDLKWLGRAVSMRHDCVHRAGYGKDGVAINLTKDDIKKLLGECKKLAENIDKHIRVISNNNFEIPEEGIDGLS